MKKFSFVLVSVMVLLGVCSAHQPRLEWAKNNTESNPIVVSNPEISQAFYGILSGHADYYQIKMDTGFALYVNIVVPDLPKQRRDFIVDIRKESSAVSTRLDGTKFQRSGFYEEFAGDQYFQGPEFKRQVPAGTYNIMVSNKENQGKYSLAIGQIESFPLGESLKTLVALPALKIHFFNKSFFAIWQGKIIQFLSYGILFLIAIITIIILIVKKIRHRAKHTHKKGKK
ncbi:MAG: hypothetical protein NTX91_04345 [candidate division SR1 bacterium]|nr:hypothetical protein [candidate division SR1 bacterium]